MDAHARGRRSVEVPRLGVDLREEVGDGASHDRLVNRRAVRDAHREAVRMGAGEPGEVVRARLCGAVADKPIVPVDGQAPGGHANHADRWWVAPAGSRHVRAPSQPLVRAPATRLPADNRTKMRPLVAQARGGEACGPENSTPKSWPERLKVQHELRRAGDRVPLATNHQSPESTTPSDITAKSRPFRPLD